MFWFDVSRTVNTQQVNCEKIKVNTPLDAKFWRAQGKDDLRRMLESIKYEGRARNVIIFVGDGMGIQTHTMARIYKVSGASLTLLPDQDQWQSRIVIKYYQILGPAERRDRGRERAGLGDFSLQRPHQDLQHGQTGRTHQKFTFYTIL